MNGPKNRLSKIKCIISLSFGVKYDLDFFPSRDSPNNHICGTAEIADIVQRGPDSYMPGDGSVLNLRCVTRHQCALKPAEYEQPGRDAEHYPPHSAVLQSDRNLSPIQVDRFSACARASPRVLITLTEPTEN